MMTKLKTGLLSSNRLARAVLIAGLAFTAITLLPATPSFAAAPATTAASPTGSAETLAEFRAVLVKYGTFGKHEKYGEIWVPTVTPQGWHPYPACQWVYTKDGWYFNDETEWGGIVHHHGRWSHDEKIGWFWVPDEDWSPGWVVWRKSDKWVGWAPMPPEQDTYLVSQPEFNNDKLWIFMDAKKFFNGGCGTTVQATTKFYNETKYVTLFDLPPGLLVDIIFVPKWKVKVITKIITIIIDHKCPEGPPPKHENPPRNPPKLGLPLLPPGDVKPDPTPKPRGGIEKPGIIIDLSKPRVGVIGKPGIIIDNPGKPHGHGGRGHGGGKGSHGEGSSNGRGGGTIKPKIDSVKPSGRASFAAVRHGRSFR